MVLVLVECWSCHRRFWEKSATWVNDHKLRHTNDVYPYCYDCIKRVSPFEPVVREMTENGPKKGRKKK